MLFELVLINILCCVTGAAILFTFAVTDRGWECMEAAREAYVTARDAASESYQEGRERGAQLRQEMDGADDTDAGNVRDV